MAAYLDYNATAPLLPAARAAWLEAQEQAWANPASVHGQGQQARHHLDQAKSRIAALLGCRPAELIVTSGGTEANALAIRSAVSAAAAPAAILASAIEHSSVLRNAERAGSLTLVPVDRCGRVQADALGGLLSPATRLVCLQFANNETGTLQDVPGLRALVRARSPAALLLLDCCQGAGKRPLDLRALGVDFAAIAGHKFGAPKGVGLLYARSGVAVAALLQGGRQQQDRRSGSEDAAAVAALAAALAHGAEQAMAEEPRQRRLLAECWAVISGALPAARWLAQDAERLANTMSLAHPGVLREILVTRLDLAGFAVSAGAACMARRNEPSHVIAALGLERPLGESAIRISIGPGTSGPELQAFAHAYVREVRALTAPG
jgi:cysteine desulfurase